MLVYEVSEYMPEIKVLNLSRATFNELQDCELWDWVETHLGMLARKMGCAGPAMVMRLFSEEQLPGECWCEFTNRAGGALQFVEWIMESERLFSL